MYSIESYRMNIKATGTRVVHKTEIVPRPVPQRQGTALRYSCVFLGCVAAQRAWGCWRRCPGVIDVVCAAGGVVHCSRWCSHGWRRGIHRRKGTCGGGMVAISAGRGEEITSAVYHLPHWCQTGTGGEQGGNMYRRVTGREHPAC
jgi:hypothetical protein